MAKRKLSPEKQVAQFWRRKGKGKTNSDWSRMIINDIPETGIELATSRSRVQERITNGLPLSFTEYHLAIALGYLITELPYVEFFTTRWHETRGHRAYGQGGPQKCNECKYEALTRRRGFIKS
jgi:hypothetical protein